MAILFRLIVLFSFLNSFGQAQIFNPAIRHNEKPEVFIEKISFTDSNTVFYCKYLTENNGELIWVDTSDFCYKFFIVADKMRYFLKAAENIGYPHRKTPIQRNKSYFFTLYFPPLPKGLVSIDLFEGELGQWNFHQIQLQRK